MNIVEAPTRSSRGDYSTMFTEPETNNCFSINDQALSNFVVNSENKERI